METTDLDTLTDQLAHTDSTSFPIAEKLSYYNIGKGILEGLIIKEQEDTDESEPTPITTVAGQRAYTVADRLHHVNWVKVNYGNGFIPARYKSQQDLISEYGNDLETVLTQWDPSCPIYWFEATEINIVPAPSAAQAGSGRLTYSAELLTADLTAGDTPTILPVNFQYLLAVYAALTWLDEEESLWKKRKVEWDTGTVLMIETMFPRARQQEIVGHVPNDNGYEY